MELAALTRAANAEEAAPPSGESCPASRYWALALAALVAVGAGLLCIWTLRVRQFGVQTDELLYVKLAGSIAHTLSPLPAVRGQAFGQPTPIYPVLLAPLVGLLPMSTAFAVAHGMNALLMASTAIPVYLLARMVAVEPPWALVAAALALVIPWMAFGLVLMTEAVAYPVFVWVVFAILRAVRYGGARADALAMSAIVVGILTRTQFVVLAVVLPVAIVLDALLRATSPAAVSVVLRDAARRHKLLLGAAGLAAVGVIVGVGAGAGDRITGNYHVLFEGRLIPTGVVSGMARHVSLLIVGVTVIPFVAGAAWVLDALFRRDRPDGRAYAAVVSVTMLGVVLITAIFNRRQLGLGLQDRYAFYVVPLVAVAFVAAIQDRSRVSVAAVVAGTGLVLGALLTYPQASTRAIGPAIAWYGVLADGARDASDIVGIRFGPVFLLCGLAIAAAVLLIVRRGRRWPVVAAVTAAAVLALTGVQTTHVMNTALQAYNTYAISQGPLVAQDVAAGTRDWVDRRVPSYQRAAILPGVVGPLPESRWLWWDVEGWNSSVVRMYDLNGDWVDTPFPRSPLQIDPATGRLSVPGERVLRRIVLPSADRHIAIVGKTLATRGPMRLVEAALPVRAAWWVRGTDRDGWSTANEPVRLSVFAPVGQAARVKIQLFAPSQVAGKRRFTLTGGEHDTRGAVPAGGTFTASAAVCPKPGTPTDLRLDINGDTELFAGKHVGLAVTDVEVAPGGVCHDKTS